MDSKMEQREMISALADGQLRADAFAQAVEAAGADPQAREAWQTYHLIGDVLRTGEAGVVHSSEAFLDRLTARLAAEESLRPLQPTPPSVAPSQMRSAANDSSFRWKLVAGFASMAAVAAVGWTVIAGTGALPSQAQLASAPVQPQLASASVSPSGAAGPTLVSQERGVMIRDAQLDEFLAAHRQFGGASALQMPAGFLRNATFEGAAR